MSLKERILQAAEFEQTKYTPGDMLWGARTEHARLQPLLAALSEVAEAADGVSQLANVPEHMQDDEWYERKRAADDAMAKLEEVIGAVK